MELPLSRNKIITIKQYSSFSKMYLILALLNNNTILKLCLLHEKYDVAICIGFTLASKLEAFKCFTFITLKIIFKNAT